MLHLILQREPRLCELTTFSSFGPPGQKGGRKTSKGQKAAKIAIVGELVEQGDEAAKGNLPEMGVQSH